jgi:hypothetical protein
VSSPAPIIIETAVVAQNSGIFKDENKLGIFEAEQNPDIVEAENEIDIVETKQNAVIFETEQNLGIIDAKSVLRECCKSTIDDTCLPGNEKGKLETDPLAFHKEVQQTKKLKLADLDIENRKLFCQQEKMSDYYYLPSEKPILNKRSKKRENVLYVVDGKTFYKVCRMFRATKHSSKIDLERGPFFKYLMDLGANGYKSTIGSSYVVNWGYMTLLFDLHSDTVDDKSEKEARKSLEYKLGIVPEGFKAVDSFVRVKEIAELYDYEIREDPKIVSLFDNTSEPNKPVG